MAYDCNYIPYSETGYFSKLAADYADKPQELADFYKYTPDFNGIETAITQRAEYPVNRDILVSVLEKQYQNINTTEAVKTNIVALANENTYTITTAHQPNLLTGYLYFIYKILHAVKLAEQLNQNYPGKRFVPVYYMGSEDNDIDELGVFRFRGEQYKWDGGGQKGAVGRMKTESLKPIIDSLLRVLGPPGANADRLKETIQAAYNKNNNIIQATQYIVNELFGKYGLVVLNPDERALKDTFRTIMEDDLLKNTAFPLVQEQSALLDKKYKSQAFPRPINLFYLDEQLRERVEKQGNYWTVVNADKKFTKEELVDELTNTPEKFSPNVILRGLYQETILPDVAFIGGGAEVAYWMQLKPVFDHYNIFYPVILLRQSALWIVENATARLEKSNLSIKDIFRKEYDLLDAYVKANTTNDWDTREEAAELRTVLGKLADKAKAIDNTLQASAGAALAKIEHQLIVLEKKMLRAEKKKMQTELNRIAAIKHTLFPSGSLQERTDNFMAYFLQYGHTFFDVIKNGIEPVNGRFLIISAS